MLWEDDPVRRPVIGAFLEAAGIPVARPEDVESALELASGAGTLALVLDANVTHPSGAEFLRQLRHRSADRTPPTLALLQPGQACLRSAMRQLGASRLLVEPFEPARLVSAVRQLAAPGDGAA